MTGYGYLLVHFVEDQTGHGERIYFSLSEGDDPLRWNRLNGGEHILDWTGGTTGVRDPHIVRGPDGFYIVATDLRVWREEGPDWWHYRHRGSRDIIVWHSTDLLEWSEPWAVTVAPENAGMAWAPESVYDPISGEYILHWSSGLGPDGDPERRGDGPSRILAARTRDFREFSEPVTVLELPGGVIDMTLHVTPTAVHRFAKQDDNAPDSAHVFHETAGSFDGPYRRLAQDIGAQWEGHVEGPLIFRAHREGPWYLWVDQYPKLPQGYRALRTDDIASGEWDEVTDFALPPATKHGVVLPLSRHEYEAVRDRY